MSSRKGSWLARIVVFTHAYDRFLRWRWSWPPRNSTYLLFEVLRELRTMGHDWQVVVGPQPASGDVAVLHVDASFVDEAYLALAQGFPRSVNFATSDISKRRVSGALLAPGEGWAGPVIVKTNLNYMGKIEAAHNRLAAQRGLPPPHPAPPAIERYEVLPSADAVPDSTWANPDLVVERFIPEPDAQGYALRTWVFMGTRERCTRHVASDSLVKADNIVRREPVEVPAALRAERERLGFDFGKFDFVVHDGRPVLLDANRTPGSSRAMRPVLKAGARHLAEGFAEMIGKAG